MSIQKIIDDIIVAEGGDKYTNDPADAGGPTRFGITEKVARGDGYKGDMRDFPRDWAERIYTKRFITGPGFGLIVNISPAIGEELVECGVNMGPSWPSKFLQRWLNAFNQQGKLWPDLAVDGVIGPATANALSVFLKQRGLEGTKVMVRALNCLQGTRYLEIAEANPSQERFVYGWLANRVSM